MVVADDVGPRTKSAESRASSDIGACTGYTGGRSIRARTASEHRHRKQKIERERGRRVRIKDEQIIFVGNKGTT